VTCGVSIPSFVVASASAIAALLVSPAPASAGDYDIDFVTAFAEACVPQRMSYPGTVDTARAAGWREVERTAHPELDALMAKSEEAASDPELKPTFAYTLLAKAIAGIDHHLVVSRSSFVLDPDENPPDPWVLIGCYLYNLDATAPVDPAPVTALIGDLHSGRQPACRCRLHGCRAEVRDLGAGPGRGGAGNLLPVRIRLPFPPTRIMCST
jgi:hypothetical protein